MSPDTPTPRPSTPPPAPRPPTPAPSSPPSGPPRKGATAKTPYERFIAKVAVNESGCWVWTRATQSKGYGSFAFGGKGKTVLAHRWSYEYSVGPVPEGMQLDHLCHTADLSCPGGVTCRHRRCVNPTHLEPVTNLQNAGRSVVARKTHCKNNHPFTPENTRRNRRGARQCRTCGGRQTAAWKERVRAREPLPLELGPPVRPSAAG